MNYRAVQLVLLLLSFSPVLFAQTAPAIYLKGGRITPASMTPGSLDSFYQEAWFVKNQTYGLLQFEVAPTEATKMRLSAAGIELLQYIPDHSYTVSLVGKPSFEVLKGAGVRAIMSLHPEQKMDAWLSRGTLPHWAVKTNGTVDVLIAVVKTIPVEEAKELLKEKGLEVIATDLAAYHILKLRVASNRLKELANLPVIEYVQAAPPPDQPLNFNSRSLSRSALLNASVSDGGKGLNGEGVAVGIGDNADPQFHVDFSGRLINRSAYPVSLHGVHTTGIMAGAGIVNELYRGYAPKATIISQVFSGILTEAATYVQDYGMVLTNNSYGNIIDCEYDGNYDLYAQLLDQQAFDIPTLEHVFATGNSGGSTCAPYALGFHTVLGGYQSAKNVMSVGATTDSGIIATFSSRGPVKDGRLKPELTAMGQSVISTVPTNGYGFNSGTSMAAPAVSGGLALLYQRYRQLNGGVNPKSALMKALMCNGATDAGNTGPDFFYGFGNLNLLRSLEMLEGRNYFNTTVSNSAANNHTITVPANTAQLKVMLYWHDPAASLISSKTLVNDLDLEITTPAAATLLPKILDTASANLNAPAVMGADHLNNIEQIVIDNPGAGNYTLKVKGTAIGQGAAQEYVVVYDAIPVSLKLTYPIGGEALVPGERVKIQWDAYGDANTSFKLEYSIDGGTNWLLIASGLDAARRIYTWTVPATPTANAMVRAVKETTGATNSCSSFVIAGLPTLGLAPVQCDGYISINWTAAAGATDYEVMLLRGDSMAPIATTNALNYTFSGLNRDSVYWISVRARISGKPGRRAVAISRQPNSGTCTGTISNGDLRLAAITAPYSGRKFTSTQLSTTTAIQVQVKNLDDVAITGFTLKYRINAGGFVSEAVTATIAAGATFNYTFTTTADFSSPGNYTITAVVKNNAADPVTGNDTLITLIRHVDNQPVNLSTPFLDNLETAASITYTRDTVGLIGGDRYDYQHSTAFGRLLPFVNTGFAYSGTKAFTVDIDRYSVAGNTNYIIGTYNLAAYSSATSDLRLDFYYLNHGQPASAANKVWIRGSDTQPWIEAYDLNSHTEAGLYKKTGSIELSRLLAANGQNFSSSFSIRWGQFGQLPATMKEAGAGYTFDDIRLYQVTNDLQLVSIVEPLANSCALTATTPVKVAVRNSSFAVINNIPVRYRINSGAWIVESISAIGPNTTVTYSFTTVANLSGFGTYTIEAVVDYAGDSFRDNDTSRITIVNVPTITSFPSIETFEGNSGYWYAAGRNSSWEWGMPSSKLIKSAASGAKAWKTHLVGNYNDNEASYLYSPCYNISGLTVPTLSFSVALDFEDCGTTLCDGAWVEYSSDGISWTKLGAAGTGYNWYNKTTDRLWSIQSYTRWHVATIPLPIGLSQLRLRFALASDAGVNREGMAIDDIHIYDNTKGLYEGPTLTAPIIQTVSGSGWVDFTSGGKLLASLQPSNQNLGATAIRGFIDTTVSRWNNAQYYHGRNLTIKPANRELADSVAVRFYFTDRETEKLLTATGCTNCGKPTSAYELGVSQYSDPDTSFENGSVLDDQQGVWRFIKTGDRTLVPFDKGYYAEFKVKSFSEFWLNNGGLDKGTPLPIKLMEFSAQRSGVDALLRWSVGSETEVARYEIEVARGIADLNAARFSKIGEVVSGGNTTVSRLYSFTDTEADKFGTRYYRLKAINNDGSFRYSAIRPVTFADAVLWNVYPNPSAGIFFLVYETAVSEKLSLQVFNAQGALVMQEEKAGTGYPQKLVLNLKNKVFAAGMYLLKVKAGDQEQAFKLNKQ